MGKRQPLMFGDGVEVVWSVKYGCGEQVRSSLRHEWRSIVAGEPFAGGYLGTFDCPTNNRDRQRRMNANEGSCNGV